MSEPDHALTGPSSRQEATAEALMVGAAPQSDPLVSDFAVRAGRLPAANQDAAPRHGDADASALAAARGATSGVSASTPRRAAVLLALGADFEGGLSVLMTERAAHLSTHAGQIALPGGKIEAGESAPEAALREAHEEVGLPASAVEVVGAAPSYLTRTGFLVSPILAIVRREAKLNPDPNEVASAFLAPYSHLMTPHNYREVEVMRDGRPRTYYETMVGPHRIWGVTAGILRLVHENLYAP